jgi:Domain of Unknown Function (DUF1080)
MKRFNVNASTILSPLNLAVVVASMLLDPAASAQQPAAPAGFTALFNGRDLGGWRGGDTVDHRKWLAMPEGERAAKNAEWTADMKKHWSVENAELVNDGHGKYATTEKDYGDFELLLEYKTIAKADSGIYLRGVPQVQIWDSTEAAQFPIGAGKGSGGLWNNSAGAPGKDPLVLADKPFGQWNKFRIVMVGSRASVWLNDQLVVDHAILENYYDKEDKSLQPEQRRPVPAKGPIQLQTHGGEIRWRNVIVREIPAEEANAILQKRDGGDFESVFNGKDFSGWAGPIDEYETKDGTIACKPGQGGTIYTRKDYSDFVVRLEFKLPPGGNGGLAIRYPGSGDPAYVGMCKIQVLDDSGNQSRNLDPRQENGSAYGMVGAHDGYLRAPGQWNFEQVTVQGSTIKVELNGTTILDADLSDVTDFLANHPHPGKDRSSGYFGIASQSNPVQFRNIRIKRLR